MLGKFPIFLKVKLLMKRLIPPKAIFLFVLVLIILISISVLGRSLNHTEKTPEAPVVDSLFEMKNRVQISDQEFAAVLADDQPQPAAVMDTTIFSELTSTDLSKIEDAAFLSYVTQIRSEKSAPAEAKAFKVFIKYQEGERENLKRLLGQSDTEEVYFYNALNLVSVQIRGDILANVLKEGEDTVISVNTDSVNEISDTLTENEFNTFTLGGGTEEITEVSRLHQAGYTGKGTAIAILDTGLDASHVEFGDRVILEKCFSTKFGDAGSDDAYYLSLCKDQKLTADSAYPYSDYPQTVTHGSHVAGIAAGKGGMAPEANIIAVQVFSQYLYKDQSGTRWATTAAFDSDYLKGLDYIYGLAQEGVPIAAVNLSLGSGEYYDVCDDSDRLGISTLFRKLNELGITVVTAAGNSGTEQGYDGWISAPACYSGSFTVGALDYHGGKPKIADFSSYNNLVDLLAPGTKINSACLSGYCEKSGTSMAAPAVSGAIALVKGNFQGASGLDAAAFLQKISTVSYQKSGVSRKSLNFHTVFSDKTLDRPSQIIPVTLSDDEIISETDNPSIAAVIPDDPVMVDSIQKNLEPGTIGGSGNTEISAAYNDSLLFPQKAWRWDFDHLPSTGFPAGRLTTLTDMPSGIQYQNLGLSIEIPAIDSNSQIVSLPLTDTGFAADWLGKDAGLLQGSNLPGEGISIIAAHNHLSTGETGPFLFLMDLQQKDRIFIRKTGGEMLSYAVYANIRITPDEVEKLDELAKTDCLILVTCEDQSIDGGYAYRRVVFAELFETK